MPYKISELAALTGLTRTTVLYYEKLNLIKGRRQSNGYRWYNDKDLQRVRLLQQLQAGGLTLNECKICLDGKMDKHLLSNRLKQLDKDIEQKQRARELLNALLGKRPLRYWHDLINRFAPDAHLEWLKLQGFNEKNALHLKWLSKDMNEHDNYMLDFMEVFKTLERWGPGDESDSINALNCLTTTPLNIIDIGCGKGFSTLLLAEKTNAKIIAVDNEASALEHISKKLKQLKLEQRITTSCASMTDLPFNEKSFDLIWSEGAAYIMGVENALKQWQPLLKANGYLVFSDLVWQTESPSEEVIEFWKNEYSDMQTVSTRLEQIKAQGYRLIEHFSLSEKAWKNYYLPLKDRVKQLTPLLPNSSALMDLNKEIALYENHLNEFGYQMFVLQLK